MPVLQIDDYLVVLKAILVPLCGIELTACNGKVKSK